MSTKEQPLSYSELKQAALKAQQPTTEKKTPSTWLDGSPRDVKGRDTRGYPLDVERALVDFDYAKENMRAINAHRTEQQAVAEREAFEKAQTEARAEMKARLAAQETARQAAEVAAGEAAAEAYSARRGSK